jgi:hypothetical protein
MARPIAPAVSFLIKVISPLDHSDFSCGLELINQGLQLR